MIPPTAEILICSTACLGSVALFLAAVGWKI